MPGVSELDSLGGRGNAAIPPGMIPGWEKAPEGLVVSPEELSLSGGCSVYPWAPAAWHSFCSLFAAPELGCSQTKLSVYMECLKGVCHESVANRANQESWLVGKKTLTL